MRKRLRKKLKKLKLEKLVMTNVIVKGNDMFFYNEQIMENLKKEFTDVNRLSPNFSEGILGSLYGGFRVIKVSKVNMLMLLSAVN